MPSLRVDPMSPGDSHRAEQTSLVRNDLLPVNPVKCPNVTSVIMNFNSPIAHHLRVERKCSMPMPYTQTTKLPETVRNVLPPHARLIYQAAFNSSWNQYKERVLYGDGSGLEEISHRIAWQAVAQSYEKCSDGKWRLKKVAA